jgi:hypothetical protein
MGRTLGPHRTLKNGNPQIPLASDGQGGINFTVHQTGVLRTVLMA